MGINNIVYEKCLEYHSKYHCSPFAHFIRTIFLRAIKINEITKCKTHIYIYIYVYSVMPHTCLRRDIKVRREEKNNFVLMYLLLIAILHACLRSPHIALPNHHRAFISSHKCRALNFSLKSRILLHAMNFV